MRPTRSSPPQRRAIFLSAAIFIVALFVRLAPWGLYVTPDEPIWVYRSVQFSDAVAAGDWTRIPQTGHPGVTTMALGALGVRITQVLWPAAAETHLDWIRRMAWLAPENAAAFGHLGFFLPAGRSLVAITTSLGLAMAYLLGRHRVGERAARWLALLLALDPFFAGYAGLLHTDALQATFVLLAVLLVLPGTPVPMRPPGIRPSDLASSRRRSAIRWVGVALLLALSGLTKSLGLLVAPGLALAMLICGQGTWLRRVISVGLVALLSLGLVLAFTPPFFSSPGVALNGLLGAVSYHEGIGLRDVFFLGEMHTDPGPLFYPVVLLFRMTPPVLLGVLAVVFRRRRAPRLPWRVTVAAALPALLYVAALTLATKKFDRYILSVVPLLTLVAALPLALLRRPWRRGMLFFLLLPWAAVMVVPLHYATPLLGGPRGAEGLVPLGWGEASGLAAGRLNELLPDPRHASLLTTNVPGAADRFAGVTYAYSESLIGCADAIIGDPDAMPPGYVELEPVIVGARRLATLFVADVSLSGVETALPMLPIVAPGALPGIPQEAIAPKGATAALGGWVTGRVGLGNEFLWIHAPACHPLTDAQLTALFGAAEAAGELSCVASAPIRDYATSRCELRAGVGASSSVLARFAGALDLIAATWDRSPERSEPLPLQLRFQPQVTLGEADVYLALQTGEGVNRILWAEGGQRLVNDKTWPAPQWPVNETSDATTYLWIPDDVPPGTYALVLMLAGTEGWLPLNESDGSFGGTALPLGEIRLSSSGVPAELSELQPSPDPGWPGLRVLGVKPPQTQVLAGLPLHVAIGLERTEGSPPERLSWALVCDGEVRQELIAPWAPTSPAAWGPGERYKVAYALRVDPSLPAESCQLLMQPADAADRQGTDPSRDGAALVLGSVEIGQRPRRFSLPQEPVQPLDVVAVSSEGERPMGRLIGSDLTADTISPGQPLDVTLYWEAVSPSTRDYTAFVHLVGGDGQIWAQSDHVPAAGEAPTTTWVEGEIIVDQHRLAVPQDIPPGTYRLYTGLYNAESGERAVLTVAGIPVEGNRVALAMLSVAP